MADTLRVPPSGKKPTYLNRWMAAGLLGGLALPIGALGFAVAAVLGVAGAYFGKKEQEKDEQEGRVVSAPGLFKKESIKDGLIGLGLGSMAGGLLSVGILLTAAFTLAPVGAAAAFVATPSAGVALAATAAMIAGPVIGGLLGLSHGKNRMEYEWKAAKEYVAANGEYKAGDISQSKGKEVTQERYKDTVTPDEYRAMQEKMAAGKPRAENPALQAGR
ncbi:MAG: hypothetical protein LW823_00400 [Rickettsiales bacterium]|jgi:hypothetical protein|nr:hypothetical protein [Rickettsiales bacterium]